MMDNYDINSPSDSVMVHVPSLKEFSIISEVIDCEDVGFESQTFVFSSNGRLKEALKLMEEYQVTFKISQ